jgi:hypothetical protein
MANDHYISRFLTKPWEVGQRQLWFYDFKTDSFGRRSSESLFAEDGLHSQETGDRLNELIETPVSLHRAETVNGDGILTIPGKNWKVFRALVALIRLQPQRHLDKEGAERRFTLDDMIGQGENFLDGLAAKTQEEYTLIAVTLRDGAFQMSFTDAVYFPIPMVGSEPVLAMPLTPGHFIALPRKGYQKSSLEEWLRSDSSISAFSIGLGGSAQRVIVPPGLQPSIKEEPDNVRKMLRELRSSCREIFNTIGQANAMVGLPSFTYSGGDD